MAECLAYSETSFFTNLIIDYLREKEELKQFYSRFPSPENFKEQLLEKQKSFPAENREILVKSLQLQYKKIAASKLTEENIQSLLSEDTFTVTTGHQLNLFTGPLYFIYKIITTINLASELKSKFPDYNFVPVYWMATEDHDFEEISFFYLHGKKFQWNPPQSKKTGGAVGEIPTEGLDEVFELFSAEIGASQNAEKLKDLFRKAYLEHKNLTDTTFFLANELFKKYGLLIIDSQVRELKALFAPFVKEELLQEISHKNTLPVAEELEKLNYKIQVNPREINLFYLKEGFRERIIEKEGKFFIHGTQETFSKEEILNLVESEPEKFSPNVITRPLYQEVILPNLAYIGGGGELAYWFELKKYFEAVKVTFPILFLRNSALLESSKQSEKLKKLNISNKELFLKQHELINKKVRQISDIEIDFSEEKELLVQQFQKMYDLAEKTDKSFLGAVKAQEVKQLKGLDHLERRLLKAQKRKLEDEVTRIIQLQNELFPNKKLQERHDNFSEYYLEFGEKLIPQLKKELNPFDFQFKIIVL